MKRLAMQWLGMKGTAVLAACCMGVMTAQAGGFASQNMSASGLGVANAVVASADDVSAAAYNPAGIAWQDGFNAMLGMDVRYRNSSVKVTGGVAPNQGSEANLNHLYASWMPHDGSIGFSLGYNTPYVMDNNWDLAFPATTGRSTLKLNRLSLDTIYAVNSSLAVAAGVDWYMSTIDLTLPGQNYSAKNKSALGGHLSAKWKFTPAWSVGAMARLGSKIKFSDRLAQPLTLNLPDEFTLGVAHEIGDALRLELDTQWSRWSKLKSLGNQTLSMRDSLTVMTGATWFWRENSQFRFGYAYDQGANKDTGFNPVVADQTGHKLTLGAGGDMFGFHADLAFAYTFSPKSTVQGAYAGTYRDRRYSVAFSVAKRF